MRAQNQPREGDEGGRALNDDAVAARAVFQRERAVELEREVARWLRPLDGREHVLDSGCGTGAFAVAIAGRVSSVVGVDTDEASLAVGRRASPANVTLSTGDAAALPFGDASFDLAGCFRVLHHVPDPGRVVAELARVVRPGGRVLLVDQLREPDETAAAANDRFERERDASHTTTLAADTIRDLLESAGLTVARSESRTEPRELERFLDLAGLQGAARDHVRSLAPAPTWEVEVGWFLARR